MQTNRLIALIDVSDFNNHFIEVLLLANILEKQYEQLTVLDLNNPNDNQYIDKTIKSKKEADLSSFKIFDRSLYQTIANSPQKQNKALNIANQVANKNQNLLLSLSLNENNLNADLLKVIPGLIVFADIKNNLQKQLIKFFVNNNIKEKKITLVIYNYIPNSINDEKELLSIRKMVKGFNISIVTIDKIPTIKSINDIAHIDPWDSLYKTIKKII